MVTGKITQIIGAVIDVEFPRESMPRIYEALQLTMSTSPSRCSSSSATAWCARSPWEPRKA